MTKLLGVTLPPTLSFDFPNIEQLTKYISYQILEFSTEDDTEQVKKQQEKVLEANLLNEVEQASEEELEDSIDEILTSINY